MSDYDIDHIIKQIKTTSSPVILFGAGDYGKLALYALEILGIKVSYFCDSNEKREGEFYCNIKIISLKTLSKLGSDIHVFISSNSITSIAFQLEEINISNVYNCASLFKKVDFSLFDIGLQLPQIKRRISLYEGTCLRQENKKSNVLDLMALDIVITEACTLKCKDCSNLMQYYVSPKNTDLDMLFRSIDKLMKCVDRIREVRVLGGEPFVNKQIGKIVNKLVLKDNIDNVVIYTNATIVPNGENLLSLQNDKVIIDITNYGNLSKKYDKLIETLENNKICFNTETATEWTDSGKIQYRERTGNELAEMFSKCCVRDVMTLLHGKLYRCPFSANGTNLKAIPFNDAEIVDMTDQTKSINVTKSEIIQLYECKQYLLACSFCNGRDYRTPKVTAGTQAKKHLTLPASLL